MNKLRQFLSSTQLRLFLLFILNIAIFSICIYFGIMYTAIYIGSCVFLALISIFFLANRRESDGYKITVFLLMFFLPLLGLGYSVALKLRKGGNKIRREWSDITYRNRKILFQGSETMANLAKVSTSAFKNTGYIFESTGMPCFQNANIKYYSFGESYFKDLFDECKKAKSYILIECHKIVPGKVWTELFDILRIKAREGVSVKLVFDDVICTKYISRVDFSKMHNHGIETVAFNRPRALAKSFYNCRNFKRVCVIDGKIGFIGGFNIEDQYVNAVELSNATKDCAVRLMGEAVKNLIVMFFEDYQFASKKVVNLQDYLVDSIPGKNKDWVLPYSTNPVTLEKTNKNILLSMINNARESISITTTYIALDDELKNALIVASKSGVKVRLIFSGENENRRVKILARSYFYELLKEGIEVYEYTAGKMSTKLILIDNNSALISTNNLDCLNTYKHFNAGIYVYGDAILLMYNDMREIINSSQLITIKDLQKRKISEKISATWSKFIALFR